MNRRTLRAAVATVLLSTSCLWGTAAAQVVRDGTLGQNVPLGGDANNFIIDEVHGELQGSNLFHSFLQFDLSGTQSATFTGLSPIDNVISRVTGGPSTIGGLISSDIPGANLFLMNPDGITFTDSATLDVSGSFHVSTADYLQFSDGARFFAAPGVGSVLSPVDVAAFGFLGASASIAIDQSILRVPDGQTFSIVGGDVDISGGPFGFLSAPGGRIQLASVASAGQIGVDPADTDAAAIEALGTISLSDLAFVNVGAPGLDAGSIHVLGQNLDMRGGSALVADNGGRLFGFAQGGEAGGLVDIDARDLVTISGGSYVDASGTTAGRIALQAGTVSLDGNDTTLAVNFVEDSAAGGIDVQANGGLQHPEVCAADICVTDHASIETTHFGAGTGAGISISGGDVLVEQLGVVQSTSLGNGTGGAITIDGASIVVDIADVKTRVSGNGIGGSISIAGQSVDITSLAIVETVAEGNGAAGDIFVFAGNVDVSSDARLESRSLDPVTLGSTGDILIVADSLTVDDAHVRNTIQSAGIGGDILISVDDLNVRNEGTIATRTHDPGQFLELGFAGDGGDIFVTASRVSVESGGGIETATSFLDARPIGVFTGFGDGGDIVINATDSVEVRGDRSSISTVSLGFADENGVTLVPNAGDAGDITVGVLDGSLLVEDGARIESGSFASVGDAGYLNVQAQEIDLLRDAQIQSSSNFHGNAGHVVVEAADRMLLLDSIIESGTIAGAAIAGSGSVGDVNVSAPTLEIRGVGGISAVTNSLGDSGNVLVEVDRLTIADGGEISNSTGIAGFLADGTVVASTGGGGSLVIRASESVTVTGKTIILSEDFNQDVLIRSTIENVNIDGGDPDSDDGARREIVIETPELLVEDGGRIATTTFGIGDGGDVQLNVDRLFLRSGGAINADTSAEVDGGFFFQPASTGSGGSVIIDANESVTIEGFEARIEGFGIAERNRSGMSSITKGHGNAGNIDIQTPLLVVDGAQISADTTSEGIPTDPNDVTSVAIQGGRAGNITIDAEDVRLLNGGQISANTTFSEGFQDPSSVTGDGGSITINASNVLLAGTGPDPIDTTRDPLPSALASGSFTSGRGGDVIVNAENLEIRDGGLIGASSTGSGDAGDISVDVADTRLLDGSIRTAAEVADGGNIVIGPGGLLRLVASDISTSVESGVGSGGNITLDPRTTVLDSSEIRADAFGGDGGNINLNSRYLIATPGSQVSASSELGNAGVIDVAAPDIAIVGSLTSLPADFLAAAALFRPRCEVRETDEGSSLVVVNRAGVPASPEGLLLANDAPEPLDPASLRGMEARPQLMAALSASSDGSDAFNSGQFDEAQRSFAAASRLYADAGDDAAREQAMRSLSEAQQASGDYEGAVDTLNELLAAAQSSGDDAGVAQALASLGNAFIALEQPALAREHFSRGIKIATDADEHEIAAQIKNNQANLDVIQGKLEDALELYQQSAALASNAGDRLQTGKAYANGARVALRAERYDRARELLSLTERELRQVDASHDKVYALIHLSRTYHRLAESPPGRRDDFRKAYTMLRMAADMAESLQDDRALAYAQGNMARLYEADQRYREALVLTRQAIAAAERAEAYESFYRWHWQMGRIFWAAGQHQDALDAYRRAVAILRVTRQETAYSYLRSETSFRDGVGPVYQDLVDGLLRVSETATDADAQSLLLQEARDTVELLKAAELREYFRDECVADLEARAVSVEAVSADAAIIYPVLFPDRLELLVSTRGGLTRYTTTVDAAAVDDTIEQLRTALQDPGSGTAYLGPGQQLYEWLIRPFEKDIQDSMVDTLVFVPSAELRTIPMSVLHDGDDFLIRDYAIAVTPILALTDPQPLDRQDPKLLLAGISKGDGDASPLPYVPGELRAIQEIFGGRLLLDESFTNESFVQEMQDQELDIVHIASHGVFTGDPEKSYLLTHKGRISMNQINDYIGRTRFRETPLELLVLSACETAKGDERAALGLSGVAIRAGARSALGSLWAINDPATATLIEEFYKQLQDSSLSRADALQKAQLTLIDSDKRSFQHPYYWSAFLLISNWL